MTIDKKWLEEHKHIDSWKYLISAYNVANALKVYKEINECLLKKKKENFEDILNGKKEIDEREKNSFPPGDFIDIGDLKVGMHFLLELNTENFFQSARNYFDYISHILVDFYLPSLKQRRVDFDFVAKQNISEAAAKQFILDIANSQEYKYICDYNNQTKHNCEIGVSLSWEVDTLDIHGKIPEFDKKVSATDTNHHDCEKLSELFDEIFRYVSSNFEKLIALIHPQSECDD